MFGYDFTAGIYFWTGGLAYDITSYSITTICWSYGKCIDIRVG